MAMLPQLLEHLPALGVIMYHNPLLNYFNGKKSFHDVERYLNALCLPGSPVTRTPAAAAVLTRRSD